MNNVEILKKHIVADVPLVLTNEDGTKDKIMLKTFNMAEQSLAFKLSKGFGNQKEDEIDISSVDDKYFDMMFDLLKSVVLRSVEGIDDETAENFVLSNITEFQEVLPKLLPKGKNQNHAELIKKKQGVNLNA